MAAAQKQQRKFDPSRPHGTVYGHISGKFEQGGILFGANGLPLDEDQIAQDEERLAEENAAAERARAKELASK